MSTEETTATDPATTQTPDPKAEAASREAKTRELLTETKKAKEVARVTAAKLAETEAKLAKYEAIAKAQGVDIEQDAEKIRAQREAETRTAHEKAQKIERAVYTSLIGRGQPLDARVTSMIVNEATRSGEIEIEGDKVTGLEDFLGSVLKTLTPVASDPARTSTPTPARPGVGDVTDAQFQNVKTFTDFSNMPCDHAGKSAAQQFLDKYPEQYRRLWAAHVQSLHSPIRTIPRAQP